MDVFRLTLNELNLTNLQSFAFGLSNRLELHFVAPKKDDWYVEAIARVSSIHFCFQRLHLSVAAFFEDELHFTGVTGRFRIAASFPFHGERAA